MSGYPNNRELASGSKEAVRGFDSHLDFKRGYSAVMPGGTRFERPSSPVTLAAVVVLIFIVLWVLLSNLGWIR
jgi:hypothetical protein